MNVEFSSGVVLRVIEHHFSETDVSGSPSIFDGRTYISTDSKRVCNTDVWLNLNGKDKCISIDKPFKALEGHTVTVSYEVNTGKLIQIKNDSTGEGTWASQSMKERYAIQSKNTNIDELSEQNKMTAEVMSRTMGTSAIILSAMFLVVALIPFFELGFFISAVLGLLYGAVVLYQWKKSIAEYNEKEYLSYCLYAPFFLFPFFISSALGFFMCSVIGVILIGKSKELEYNELKSSNIPPVAKEKPKSYAELREEYYSSRMDNT